MRHFLIFLIILYQRFISPYKGGRCAYGCVHGGPTCSARVKQILATHGVRAAWPLVLAQFRQCRAAYEALAAARPGERVYWVGPGGDRMAVVCCFIIRAPLRPGDS